jgi:hypothetical protein
MASDTEAPQNENGAVNMAERDEKKKTAERHITDEVANQASQEPCSAGEEEAKQRRAQAEKEFREAQ